LFRLLVLGSGSLKSVSYKCPPTSFGPENSPMHFKIYISLTTKATAKGLSLAYLLNYINVGNDLSHDTYIPGTHSKKKLYSCSETILGLRNKTET
jgi:hypothetical protein